MESIRPARKWQMRLGVVGAVALVTALSGCDTSGGSATTNSGSGNAVAAAVTDNVAKYKALPTFTAPEAPPVARRLPSAHPRPGRVRALPAG